VVTYIVSENVNETNKMGYKVVFDKVEDDVWCLCRLFQSKAILCRHALGVLRLEQFLQNTSFIAGARTVNKPVPRYLSLPQKIIWN
jgi:hypothetical protein